jgi:hypothetical protein
MKTFPGVIFCPICERELVAVNLNKVWCGEDMEYIYMHNDKPHPEVDLSAMIH